MVSDQEDVNIEEFENLVKIGLWCVECELNLRPTMKQVIWMMEGIVVIPHYTRQLLNHPPDFSAQNISDSSMYPR